MRLNDRLDWIVRYCTEVEDRVDVLNRDFVRAYVNATGAECVYQFYGADTCPQLGRDLSRCFKQKKLLRGRVGLPAMESGFPKWVYVYYTPSHKQN